MTLKELYREREAHEAKARELTDKIHEAKKRTMLKCVKCQRRTRIDKLVYRELYFYERPYGCTGGDQWHEDRECQWDCPKCNHRNRCYTTERVDDKSWPAPYATHPTKLLKQYFGSVEKVYGR